MILYFYDYDVSCAITITPGNTTYPFCFDLKDSTNVGNHLCYANIGNCCRHGSKCKQKPVTSKQNHDCWKGISYNYDVYDLYVYDTSYGCICSDTLTDNLCTLKIYNNYYKETKVQLNDATYYFYNQNSYDNNTDIDCYLISSDELILDQGALQCFDLKIEEDFDKTMICVYLMVTEIAVILFSIIYFKYCWVPKNYHEIN